MNQPIHKSIPEPKHREAIKTGWAPEISSDEYHSGPGLGSTGIIDILDSPMHFYERIQDEPTREMRLGTLLHHAILEKDDFKRRVAIQPEGDRRFKEVKLQIKEWEESLPENALIISHNEAQWLASMRSKIDKSETVTELLRIGIPEVAGYFWESDDLLYKIKPDLRMQRKIIVDFKTVRNASFESFSRDIASKKMHVQAAYYLDVANKIYPEGEYDTFIWVAIERDWPHGIGIYSANDVDIQLGRNLYRQAINKYCECRLSGVWHGYADRVQNIALPAWAHFEFGDEQ